MLLQYLFIRYYIIYTYVSKVFHPLDTYVPYDRIDVHYCKSIDVQFHVHSRYNFKCAQFHVHTVYGTISHAHHVHVLQKEILDKNWTRMRLHFEILCLWPLLRIFTNPFPLRRKIRWVCFKCTLSICARFTILIEKVLSKCYSMATHVLEFGILFLLQCCPLTL